MMRPRTTLLKSFLLTIASASGGALATEDDIIVDRASAELGQGAVFGGVRVLAVNRGNGVAVIQDFNEVQFERRIFTNDGNAERGKSRIDSELVSAIDRIDLVCDLNDAQKHKLTLAGRADRRHFWDRVEAAREFGRNGFRIDQNEIRSLQRTAEDGLLGRDSFFAKTISATLTTKQLDQCQQWRREEFVQNMLKEIESKIELEPAQQQALIKLMREQIPSPQVAATETEFFWMPDRSLRDDQLKAMRHKFAFLAEEKVKPLLSDVQWQNLRPTFEILRRFDGRVLERP